MTGSDAIKRVARIAKNQEVIGGGLEGAARHFLVSERFLTPFVMMDRKVMLDAVSRFRSCLPGVQLLYAVKANFVPGVIRCFHEQGLGFDVASSNEIELALSLGVSPDELVVSHPVKDMRTCVAMFRHRVRAFAVDNLSELHKVSRIPRDYVPEVFIRIRTESEDVGVDLNKKFGCRLQDAPALAALARDLGFNPVGITFHVGTQSYLAHNYKVAFEHCRIVAAVARAQFGIELTQINMGGGFCDEEVARSHGTTQEDVLAEIGKLAAEARADGFTVLAEPGRALVADAGTLVTQVIGIHDRGRSKIVHVDDGVYSALSREIYENKQYMLDALPRSSGRQPFSGALAQMTVCGRTCDSIDTLSSVQLLPADLQVGDYLFVRTVGAYGVVCASMFNSFDPASTIVFSNEEGEIKVHHASQPILQVRDVQDGQDGEAKRVNEVAAG